MPGQADRDNEKGHGGSGGGGSSGRGGTGGGNTGAGSSQSADQGRGGQADVGGSRSSTGDSADNGSRDRDNGLAIGQMPDHIAELSPTFDRNFTDEDKKRAIDDYNSANSFQNTLETFASIIGLGDPTGVSDLVGGLLNEYGLRKQQPEESYASYLGRTNAANASPGMMESMGFSLGKAALGPIGKLADIGKVARDAYSRSSQVPGGTPSQSPRSGDNDANLSGRNVGNPSIASAPIIPETPETTQPVKQPFSVGKLDRDRYGLLSALR